MAQQHTPACREERERIFTDEEFWCTCQAQDGGRN
jgi:hypothetical protein